MSWIQDNKVPAAILGLTGAGVVGLGVMLFNAWSAASEAQDQFDVVKTSIANLKGTVPAPTPENLAKKKEQMAGYSTEVGKLTKVLYGLQPPDQPTTADKFQAKLKTKVADIKKEGANRLPAVFNLGFDQYADELPKDDAVASELSTYLDAVDLVVRLALKSGVISIDTLDRSLLPAERPASGASKSQGASKKGSSAPAAAALTERRQVRLTIRTDQAALQTLLSGYASPSEMPFFTVVRLLRIENEVKEGPLRTPISTGPGPEGDAAPTPEGSAAPKPGVQPAPADSKVVLGRELLRAYIEIDLVKFLNTQTAASGSSR